MCLPLLHQKARGKPDMKVKHQQPRTERSSQEWKSDEVLEASTVRPVYDKFVIDNDMDSDTATEPNLSKRSRSFLH